MEYGTSPYERLNQLVKRVEILEANMVSVIDLVNVVVELVNKPHKIQDAMDNQQTQQLGLMKQVCQFFKKDEVDK